MKKMGWKGEWVEAKKVGMGRGESCEHVGIRKVKGVKYGMFTAQHAHSSSRPTFLSVLSLLLSARQVFHQSVSLGLQASESSFLLDLQLCVTERRDEGVK